MNDRDSLYSLLRREFLEETVVFPARLYEDFQVPGPPNLRDAVDAIAFATFWILTPPGFKQERAVYG